MRHILAILWLMAGAGCAGASAPSPRAVPEASPVGEPAPLVTHERANPLSNELPGATAARSPTRALSAGQARPRTPAPPTPSPSAVDTGPPTKDEGSAV